MQNFVVVNEIEALQQLCHDLLDLGQAELDVHVVQQSGQIVIAKLENQVKGRSIFGGVLLRSADLQQANHVLVFKKLQYLNLSQCGDRKALLLVLHEHFLQGDDFSGALVLGLEHLAECACPGGAQRLEHFRAQSE